MTTQPDIYQQIRDIHARTGSERQTATEAGVSRWTVKQALGHSAKTPEQRRAEKAGQPENAPEPAPVDVGRAVRDFDSNKKEGSFDWRQWTTWVRHGQDLKRMASFSQDTARIDLSHITRRICVLCLGDTHIGSWGTDHTLFEKITDEILNTPDLFVILDGDLIQMAIKMRNVLEVSDNILPPEMQLRFIEEWLKEIQHKVLFACWDNHSVMREEAATGYSRLADILKRNVIYFNGIGHADVRLGTQEYTFAVSHRFRGTNKDHPCHGQVRYGHEQGQDREIILQGDTHRPGIEMYYDGPILKLALNSGTTQTNSGYAKRFFSLYTAPVYPCVVLDPDKHQFTPYWNLRAWKDARGE